MSSDPYRKNAETDRGRQQSFGGPSVSLNRPLVGGLKQPQQLNIPEQNSAMLNKQPKSPAVAANIGKINLQNSSNPTKSPGLGSERNMYQNNSGIQSQQMPDLHGSGIHRTNSYQVNPKHGLDYKMDLEGVGMTTSQVVNRQSNNFFGGNQQQQPAQNYNNVNAQYYSSNMRQDPHQNQFQPQQNLYQQQHMQYQPQQQFSSPYQQQPNNNGFPSKMGQQQGQVNDRMNQYRSNYQQPDQRPHSANKEQYQMHGLQFNKANHYKAPPPKIVIPEDFDGMLEFVSTATDPDLRQRVHQKLHEVLFN